MNDHDTDEYLDGYQRGHDEASAFILDHPDGMPWAVLPETLEKPEAEFEQGYLDGWVTRMREEGWPTTRAEAA